MKDGATRDARLLLMLCISPNVCSMLNLADIVSSVTTIGDLWMNVLSGDCDSPVTCTHMEGKEIPCCSPAATFCSVSRKEKSCYGSMVFPEAFLWFQMQETKWKIILNHLAGGDVISRHVEMAFKLGGHMPYEGGHICHMASFKNGQAPLWLSVTKDESILASSDSLAKYQCKESIAKSFDSRYMTETMDCIVKKKKQRRQKKKKKVDDSQLASVDKYSIYYEPDQWSPMNSGGEKKYGRRFLLRMRFHPMCLKKPDNLLVRTDLSEIVLEECLEEERCHLCSGPPPNSKVMTTANSYESVMRTTKELEKEVVFKIVPEDILSDSAGAMLFGDSKFNRTAAYIVLNMEKVTMMPPIKKTEIPLTSNKDQANPPNPVERKKYDRNFLLECHSHPLCLKKPETLTYVNLIVQKKTMKHKKCHVCDLLLVDDRPCYTSYCAKWDHETTLILIQAFKELAPRNVSLEMLVVETWCSIRDSLREKGIPVYEYSCRYKMHQLESEYRSMLNISDEGELMRESWPYFELLDDIFKDTPSKAPTLPSESSTSTSLPESSASSSSHNTTDLLQGSGGKCEWNHKSILLLIQAYKEEEPRIKSGQTSKKKAWAKIVSILQGKGITTCVGDCRGRMSVLKKQYQSMIDFKDGNDQQRKDWPYFELLDDIFKDTPSKVPALLSESSTSTSLPESSASSSSHDTIDLLQGSEGKWKWNHKSTLLLIQAYKEEEPRIKSGQISKTKAWTKIVSILKRKGITTCVGDCSGRMSVLKKQYQSMIDFKGGNDQQRKNWPYFELLDSIFKESESAEPTSQLQSTIQPFTPGSSTSCISSSVPIVHPLDLGKRKDLSDEDMRAFMNVLEKEREDFQRKHKEELRRQDLLLEEMLTTIQPSLPESSASGYSHSIPNLLQWEKGKWEISSDDDMKILMGLLEKDRREWREKYKQLLVRQDQLLDDLTKFFNK